MTTRRKKSKVDKLEFEKLEPRQLLASVTVTDTLIFTHDDVIPRFVVTPTDTVVKSGDWSDSSTWADGTVPESSDLVRIEEGFSVRYDLSSSEIDAIEISGELHFATDIDTSLYLNEITVMPTGTLTIGSSATPIDSGVQAEIVFTDTPGEDGYHFKTGTDVHQFGNGLLVFGGIEINGADKTPYIRAISDIPQGAASVTVAEVPSDWQVGDELLLPATAQKIIAQKGFESADSTETVFIERIDGNTIHFTTATISSHDGISDNPFDVSRFAHIGNLTRNVVIASENPEGIRGHILIGANADANIDSLHTKSLGRTEAVKIASSDGVTPGTNQIARYPMHAHHLANGLTLTGSVMQDSLKWAVAIHDTNNSLIDNNIVFNADGAGVVIESGTEHGNVFTNNLVVKIDGGHEIDSSTGAEGTDGSAFWFRSSTGTVDNNFGYDARGYGMNANGYQSRRFGDNATQQFDSFKGNEFVSSKGGVWLTHSQNQDHSLWEHQSFEDTLLWHMTKDGWHSFHDGPFTITGITMINDPVISSMAVGHSGTHDMARDVSIGFAFAESSYFNVGVDITDVKVSGYNVGFMAPPKAITENFPDPMQVTDATFANYVNIVYTKDTPAENIAFKNVSYLPTEVIRPLVRNDKGTNMPINPANVWRIGTGELEAGVFAEGVSNNIEGNLAGDILGNVDSDIVRELGRLKIANLSDVAVSEDGDLVVVTTPEKELKFYKSWISNIRYNGTDGDDTFTNNTGLSSRLRGNEGNDTLQGGSGSDEIAGNTGNDILIGGEGTDKLSGREGNDTLHGGAGQDVLSGGVGDDIISGGTGGDKMYGGEGSDAFTVDSPKDSPKDFTAGVDTINGDTGGEDEDSDDEPVEFKSKISSGKLYLTETNNVIIDDVTDGVVTVIVDGKEFKFAGYGDTFTSIRYYGTSGNDTFVNNTSITTRATGYGGDDFFQGGSGIDELRGGEGSDILHGGAGNDKIKAGEGNDIINGEGGNDIIDGGAGNDVIRGGMGNDKLYGGDGADELHGNEGFDRLFGGLGTDVFFTDFFDDLKGFNSDEDENKSIQTFAPRIEDSSLWLS